MAEEIVELNEGVTDLVLVGIQRRGVQLAERIGAMIEERQGAEVPRAPSTSPCTATTCRPSGPAPSWPHVAPGDRRGRAW
jgi:pyrimidine operon attenuation protein/uracil phosphoribosyltransferase